MPRRALVVVPYIVLHVAAAVLVAPSPSGAQPAAATLPPAATPRPVELLRGRVGGDSGRALPGAQVIVTRGPDRHVEQTVADAGGRWTLRFAPGTGDYLVYVSAVGRQPFRRRIMRGQPGLPALDGRDTVFTVDATLARVVVPTLATVEVRAARPRPERSFDHLMEGRAGSAERAVEEMIGLVSPEQAGDLAALAATTPQVLAAGGGVSAFGLPAGQSSVVLGGLQFTGGELPRDVRTLTRVVTSVYDPARGWFGGAQTAVELSPGTQYQWARGHLTLDAPALQATDAVGARLGQPLTGVQGSYGREGGLAHDRFTYSASVQGSRRAQEAATLLDAAPGALLAAGLSPDSVARLRALLAGAGVPLAAGRVGSSWGARTTDQLSFAGRLGTPLYDYRKLEMKRRVVGMNAYGAWRRSDALGLAPTALATRAGEASRGSLGVQGQYSSYLGPRDWLLELRSGLSGADDRTDPLLALPGGEVLVGSAPREAVTAAAGTVPGIVPVRFGGSGALATRRRSWLWETQGTLSLYPPGQSRHQVALTGDVRLDGLREDPAADRFGSYTYASLDDLAAGRPASFARALAAPPGSARVWNGFLALADDWSVRPGLRVLYGVRLEANRHATRPAPNPALAQALGVRTEVVPNTMGLSPRLGFTWRRSVRDNELANTRFGTLRVPGRSVLRGGVGEFRSLLGPEHVASASMATGLPDAARRLLCTGDAVPLPTWDGWEAGAPLPTACAGGAPGLLVDAAPSVLALAPGYTAPRSWRANLAWSTVRAGAWVQLEGTWSLNLNQPGTTDANFAGTPRFALADDARPVFVDPASIDGRTGAVSPVGARRADAFGRVLLRRSDLRSVSRQLVLTLAPTHANTRRWWATGSYVLGAVRQQAYGFDGGTAGDPRAREWARGDLDVRHQLLVQGGVGGGPVTATLSGRLASGMPFTPLVGGDINGDGLVNDRAGVPAGDASMRALFASAPGSTRDCLARAAGGIAGRNACTGPWTAALNARLTLDGRALRLGSRTKMGLNLANPLAGLDRLVNGQQLRGWGTPGAPDPVLLHVRGFDPAARRFAYAVNPRFGDASPRASAFRAPFRVTLDVSLDLARPMGVQQYEKWLGAGRGGRSGPRMTASDMLRRYVSGSPDPYRWILRQSDSLLLVRAQVESLQAHQARWRAIVDSAWAPLADSLAALGDSFDPPAASRRQDDVAHALWERARLDVQATLPGVLAPVQLRLLPGAVGELYRARETRRRSTFFF